MHKTRLFLPVLTLLLWSILPAIAIVFACEILSGRPVSTLSTWILADPLPPLVALTFVTALILGVLGLTSRPVLSVLIVAVPFLILAAISGEKLRFLEEHLYPWDLVSFRQVVDLLPVLIKNLTIKRAAFGVFATVALFALLYATRRYLTARARIPWPLRVVAIACAVVTFYEPVENLSEIQNTNILREYGITNYNWNQRLNYNKNGFVVMFALNTQNAIIRAPEHYAQDTMQGMLTAVLGPKAAGAPSSAVTPVAAKSGAVAPNVIMVMSEAFWDPTLLPSVQYSRDPLPFFHSLHAQQTGNYQISPTFAGGTANVEFEALTGFSNAYLPYGSIPYQQYINRPVPSLARLFSSMGYETAAIHTYHGWFWRRNSVYQQFGFDKFLDSKEFASSPIKGQYIADSALTERVVKQLNEATKPQFIFAVSMQNHSPYTPGRYASTSTKVTSTELSQLQRETLEVYAEGISDADQGLKTLVKAVEASGKPTLILFFGDHLPFLGPDLEIYRRTGYLTPSAGPLTLESNVKTRLNPFVLWSNFGAPTKVGTVSPSFFPLVITEALGLKHPFYKDFLSSVKSEWPVVDMGLTRDASGTIMPMVEAKKSPKLRAQEWVQHDILFGEEYSYPALFGAPMTQNSTAAALQ